MEKHKIKSDSKAFHLVSICGMIVLYWTFDYIEESFYGNSSPEYKNLSLLLVVDKKICPKGLCLASQGLQ